ncbi:hypothetical protein [Aquiflexum lacus]|uniref:hypothetical protein n=1 Tax=Aquiflexum lacus TaxID=2483805 RepID=UPI001895C786|nr:hypothetical protein [Aquiflexum lacus]
MCINKSLSASLPVTLYSTTGRTPACPVGREDRSTSNVSFQPRIILIVNLLASLPTYINLNGK